MSVDKKDVPLKNIFAVIVFTLWFGIGLLFVFVLPLSSFINIDMKNFFNNNPRLVVIFHGIYMSVTGFLIMSFRNEVGMWSAHIRTRIGNTFPVWENISGLPEEKVQCYLSFEFNRKMTIITALFLMALGIILSVFGFSM
jgi:hypothetical protein